MRVAFSMERTGGAAEDTTQCYIIGVIVLFGKKRCSIVKVYYFINTLLN